MSVQVTNLTKVYNVQKALDAISFTANKGEILGFLGPNGAGKTTTMKILTGFLQADSGEAEVCGKLVHEDPQFTKSQIGYLAEHNPLYKEMYVKEYLHMVAQFHRLSNIKQRVDEMIQQTGLELEQHKLIQSLSKGYRQRVGLAQAMLHDPQVFILDEPTSGLDPNQLVEIRSLIKQLGKNKTVIFSTHIMQEAQALCDRVIILNRGKIIADDSIQNMQSRISGQQIISIELNKPAVKTIFEQIQFVNKVEQLDKHTLRIWSKNNTDIRDDIFNMCVKEGYILRGMYMEKSSFEEVFNQLTSKKN